MHARHLPHGRVGHARFAVERFRDDARERRLADAARAGEEIGVVQPLLAQRVRERAHDVLLADELGEAPGAPLAGENLGSSDVILQADL